jgi:hypothetical protein
MNDCFKEKYLSVNMSGKYKSSFSKFRCGVAPLKIETGRYEGVSIENRTCFNNICNVNNCIENEKHAYFSVLESHLSYYKTTIFIHIINKTTKSHS